MRIRVNTHVELESEEIAKAMEPEDLGSLFSDLANRLSKDTPFDKRRVIAGQIAFGMSEEGIRLLAEVLALAHVAAKRAQSTT
jgi:hypothetical protein